MSETASGNLPGFLAFLFALHPEKDRGILANLRKGFSSGTETYAWPHLGRFCPLDKEPDRIIFQTIAAAYATHPSNDGKEYSNLGSVMRKLANLSEQGESKDSNPTFDILFRRLLCCDRVEELCDWLKRVTSMAKAKEVPVPWVSLFWDLKKWSDSVRRDEIKRHWAASYWQVPKDISELQVNAALADQESDNEDQEDDA